MSVKQRLKAFIKEQNLTIRAFEESIKASNGYVNSISKGIGKDKLEKILEIYPNVNLQWLLTGLEKNYNLDANNIQVNEPSEIFKTKSGTVYTENADGTYILTVPLVPFDAYASYVEAFQDEVAVLDEWENVSFLVDKLYKGKYLGFKTKGDSMNGGGLYDTPDKALMLGRELQRHHWKDGFNECDYGFVIITKYGMMHKDITALDLENGNITCHSRNPSPEYRDFEMDLNDVYQIFKIHKRTF